MKPKQKNNILENFAKKTLSNNLEDNDTSSSSDEDFICNISDGQGMFD